MKYTFDRNTEIGEKVYRRLYMGLRRSSLDSGGLFEMKLGGEKVMGIHFTNGESISSDQFHTVTLDGYFLTDTCVYTVKHDTCYGCEGDDFCHECHHQCDCDIVDGECTCGASEYSDAEDSCNCECHEHPQGLELDSLDWENPCYYDVDDLEYWLDDDGDLNVDYWADHYAGDDEECAEYYDDHIGNERISDI